MNPDLFDAETIARIAGHVNNLLEGIAAAPDQPLATIPLLTQPERILIDQANATDADYPRDRGVYDLIDEQVRLTPDAIAVQFRDQSLTYKELDKRAGEAAAVLAAHGFQAGTLVGIFINRSLEMLVGLLGILKAGGGYLPRSVVSLGTAGFYARGLGSFGCPHAFEPAGGTSSKQRPDHLHR